MRRRNFNLELALFPPCDSGPSHHQPTMVEEASSEISPMQNFFHHHHQQQQPLTIFYDGKLCVADVTELQARSILMLANRKLEERVRTPSGSESEPFSSTAAMQSNNNQMYSPGTGLSMRKSLQKFLQKRKNRVQEASPYHH